MSTSPAVSDVDGIALQLTINSDGRGGQQTLAMAALISPTEAVTPHHVVHSLGPQSVLKVSLRGSERTGAAVVATDPSADLALLQLTSPLPFQIETVFGDSMPEPGQTWSSFVRLPSRPDGAMLSGVVTAHAVADGIEHIVLSSSPGLNEPAGSSGAPVVIEGSLAGILARSNATGTEWYALPLTSKVVARLRNRDRVPLDDPHADTATPIVGAESDAPSGIDRLGLELEIDALSALVASSSTKTPMSIGLFGNWGSGKSFFMQKMDERVRVFSKGARGDDTSPYCASIIQLWFNAWHYIDRSLWASLGSEIFEGLAQGLTEAETKTEGRSKLEDERSSLLVQRTAAESARDEASTALSASTTAVQAHTREIADIVSKNDREIERSLGTKAIVDDILAVVTSQEEVKTELEAAAKTLGWLELSERSEVAAEQVKDILSLTSYWRSLLVTVQKRGSARWWIAVAVVAGIAVFLAPRFGVWASALQGSIASTLSALAAFTAFVSPVLWMMQRLTAPVRAARDRMKERIETTREAQLEAAKQRRAQAEQKAVQDRLEFDKHNETVKAIDQQLEALKPARQVVDFIRRRNQSTDYTKHLGVIARARQDFEELTRLMQLVRDTHPGPAATEPRFPPVDRIVLYIDDLDRCPEDKVFEVLQAVHLLLAFPLFVVVVGVDPRWLFHSLKTRLQILGGQSNGNGDDDDERLRWQSTPLNYLEKIFQIPFTLRPMGNTGYEALIDDLTTSRKPEESGHGKQDKGSADALKEQEPVDPTKDQPTSDPAVGAKPGTTLPAQKNTEEKEKQTVEQAKQASERLTLTAWEAAHMKRLFPLIPTPRATKRFVNVYRLLRGVATGRERTALIGTEEDGGYRPVLLLLAMVTGYPVEAAEVIQELLERLNQPHCPDNWWRLLDVIRATHEPARRQLTPTRRPAPSTRAGTEKSRVDIESNDEVSQWDELFQRLDDAKKLVGDDNLTSKTMGRWAPVVARYSFASGRLLAADTRLAARSQH